MMRKVVFVLVVLLAMLQLRLWVGDGSIPNVHDLRAKVTAQTRENQALDARNTALEAEVASLKQGNAAIEGRARSELGMVQGDETFYLIVDR